jgi:hypothetical protein
MEKAGYSLIHRYLMILNPSRQAYSKNLSVKGLPANFHVMAITLITKTIKKNHQQPQIVKYITDHPVES